MLRLLLLEKVPKVAQLSRHFVHTEGRVRSERHTPQGCGLHGRVSWDTPAGHACQALLPSEKLTKGRWDGKTRPRTFSESLNSEDTFRGSPRDSTVPGATSQWAGHAHCDGRFAMCLKGPRTSRRRGREKRQGSHCQVRLTYTRVAREQRRRFGQMSPCSLVGRRSPEGSPWTILLQGWAHV